MLESALWKLDRPHPLVFLAPPKDFLHGGRCFGCQPGFWLGGRVFPTPERGTAIIACSLYPGQMSNRRRHVRRDVVCFRRRQLRPIPFTDWRDMRHSARTSTCVAPRGPLPRSWLYRRHRRDRAPAEFHSGLPPTTPNNAIEGQGSPKPPHQSDYECQVHMLSARRSITIKSNL